MKAPRRTKNLFGKIARCAALVPFALIANSCLLAGDGKGVDAAGNPEGATTKIVEQGGSEIALPEEAVRLGQRVQVEIFNSVCTQCHIGTTAPHGMSLEASRALAVINRDSKEVEGMKIIVPGDPENSYMVWKIEGRSGILGMRMPLGLPPLPQEKIELIKSWIAAMK